jgi:hypothetical protein
VDATPPITADREQTKRVSPAPVYLEHGALISSIASPGDEVVVKSGPFIKNAGTVRPVMKHVSGSLTLCPDAAKILRRMMLRRGGSCIKIPPESEDKTLMEMLREMSDVVYRQQGIDFEVYT